MKKIVSTLLAVALVAGVAAPSFADTVNCKYDNKAICATESLVPTTGDND